MAGLPRSRDTPPVPAPVDHTSVHPEFFPGTGTWEVVVPGRGRPLRAKSLQELQNLLPPGTVIAGYYPGGYHAVRDNTPQNIMEPLRGELRTTYGGRSAAVKRTIAAWVRKNRGL